MTTNEATLLYRCYTIIAPKVIVFAKFDEDGILCFTTSKDHAELFRYVEAVALQKELMCKYGVDIQIVDTDQLAD